MDESFTIEIPNQLGVPVAELTIPEDWQKGVKPPRPGYLFFSKFLVSPRNEKVGVCLRTPAKKTYGFLSAHENPFLQLLRKPPHDLTEDEFQSIHLVLDHVGWPAKFKRDWCKTVRFNPSNVLSVQGVWTPENIKARGIIADTTFDTGTFVQEIWFVAPPDLFEEYVPFAERIFQSFTWRVPA